MDTDKRIFPTLTVGGLATLLFYQAKFWYYWSKARDQYGEKITQQPLYKSQDTNAKLALKARKKWFLGFLTFAISFLIFISI
jgi:hypothetical protein